MDRSIYPLTHDRPYTFGELRAAEKMLLAERQADQALSSRLRLQDRKQIDWAKTRNEEWSPLKLLADGLGLIDEDTFCWTPAGAADFVIASGARTLKVQCTMAYDERSEGQYRAGHLYRKEQEFGATNGRYFGGGRISEPTVRDVAEDLVTWRAGIVSAVKSKMTNVSYEGQGLDLLVFARGCAFDLIDFSLEEVVRPALNQLGPEYWGRIFANVYVVDDHAFAHIAKL
ncbi:hypothetical protein [Bradyrhizobium erythrophlei]|uniref:Uncharacterized protein n=1 Tax=Bradyrhizobium erythrophlei TaxID=1437360 RepID=A0A1H4Z3Z9_9BRAD|nr:hypothetical protein [Bradyrhizobium erythrophlei]SED24883.1 hypothetical protein SAMN05444164_4220 [Bradyrhizobium erythrophlei]